MMMKPNRVADSYIQRIILDCGVKKICIRNYWVQHEKEDVSHCKDVVAAAAVIHMGSLELHIHLGST